MHTCIPPNLPEKSKIVQQSYISMAVSAKGCKVWMARKTALGAMPGSAAVL